MKIFYWSPFISKVATVRAVINSAISLKRYSKKKFTPFIVNVAGEWDEYFLELENQNIDVINLTNSKILRKKTFTGFVKSRLIYFYIFFISFFPLLILLKKVKPEFFIIHLITPVPLLVSFFVRHKTKFILRVSGFPQLDKNYLRLWLWKLTLKNISYITCPTLHTCDQLKKRGLASEKKFHLLYDPVININLINKIKKNEKETEEIKYSNYYVAIGRLTKQKNFGFLIEAFKEFNKNKKDNLLIIGEGEDRLKLEKIVKDLKLQDNIFLPGYKKNIYKYLRGSKCFILSSLWEDPGFVLIEAGYSNQFVIASDCKNGPEELLDFGNNGLLFKSNDKSSLIKALQKFEKLNDQDKFKYKVNLKKKIKKFSLLSHYNKLYTLLN